MMKRLCQLILLLLCLKTAVAQDSTTMVLTPKTPLAGKLVTVKYNPAHTVLANSKNIRAVVYYFDTSFRWHADDMPMKKTNVGWQGTYKVPNDCSLLSWVFKSDSLEDKGGRFGYISMAMKDGRNLPGAYFVWGSLRSPFFLRQNPYPVDSTALIDTQVMRFWIQNEIRNHPGSYYKMVVPVFSFYRYRDTSAAVIPNIKKSLSEILNHPELPEQTWVDAVTVYENIIRDKKAADSVKELAVTKFPNGILARDKAIEQLLLQQKDMKDLERSAAVAKLLEAFPPKRFEEVSTRISDLYYDKLFRTLVYTPIIKDSNYSYLYKYLPVVPTSELPTFYHHLVEITHEQQRVPAKTLLPLSQLLIDEMMKRLPNQAQPLSEWQPSYVSQNYYIIFTHATLLYENGQYEKAMQYAGQFKDKLQYKTAAFNELYVQLLQQLHRDGDITTYLQNSVRQNAATPAMLELLKKDYAKTHGNNQDFDDYLTSLKSKQLGQQQEDNIKKEMIDLPIAPFKLESSKGGVADLEKMRGKVVVLDMWATWCAPCKAAMPGMQMAVNKFAKDNTVAFYFISTMETKPDYKQQIEKFIRQNNYPFEVLFDNKNKATGQLSETYDRYANDFHFSGIPQKLIIDKKGRLRWRSTGYYGSPSALADEISYVIKTLQSE